MKRGDLVTIAMQGDFGKPRPALVMQTDLFQEHPTVTVLLITSTLVNAPLLRTTIEPSARNGLKKTSQIMIDKVMTIKREKLGIVLGSIDTHEMLQVERCLAVFMGIAK
jgi:mRNA interferase MazF